MFHDAGGDRAATVAALPRVIRALRARGFRIVPTSAFAGETVATIQPEVPKWTFSRLIASIFFTGLRLASDLAALLFYTAIGLGLFRLGLLSILGVLHNRPDPVAPSTALATILIPAYNEAKVIQSCLTHVLTATHQNIEVVVIDDGSTDATAQVVSEMAARDIRIALFTIPNGGKANALNFGLRHSRGAVVVALDADTQFQPDTVARLLRWFVDPNVMAVAGNAKVGNRTNFLTRCQALEYITAQNLERRAYDKLGCITVVPGAVGAWRRSAVLAAGGFADDTLAEDQDLTLTLHRQGGKILYDPSAIAHTEAPDTLNGLMNQRFRWSFGTLQCLWKHHNISGQPRKIAWFVLPQILLFQVIFSTIAPIIDLSLILRLMLFARDALQHGGDVDTQALRLTLLFFCVFLCAEILTGAVAILLDRGESVKLLLLLIPQRFGYRQLLCLITLQAVVIAAAGRFVGWGHLERRATVSMDLG